MTFQQVCQKLPATDKTFHCGCATIITHLKTVPLIEYFIMLDSLCIVHYLVFAELTALPQHFSYLYFFRIGFYISEPARYDKSFSSLLSFKKRKLDFFFFNNHHLKLLEMSVLTSIGICSGRLLHFNCNWGFCSSFSFFLFSNICVFCISLEPHSSKTHSVQQRWGIMKPDVARRQRIIWIFVFLNLWKGGDKLRKWVSVYKDCLYMRNFLKGKW